LTQPRGGGEEILARPGLVELREQSARCVFVARVSAQWEQGIWREGDEVLEREPPCHVLDVRIQAAVLVDYQHQRQRLHRLGRPGQVAAAWTVTPGRRKLQVL